MQTGEKFDKNNQLINVIFSIPIWNIPKMHWKMNLIQISKNVLCKNQIGHFHRFSRISEKYLYARCCVESRKKWNIKNNIFLKFQLIRQCETLQRFMFHQREKAWWKITSITCNRHTLLVISHWFLYFSKNNDSRDYKLKKMRFSELPKAKSWMNNGPRSKANFPDFSKSTQKSHN